MNLRAVNTVSITQSPFTYKQKIHAHSGQRWEAEVTLPPVRRADAEVWVAFLLSEGPVGTFLLGDPICKIAQGSLGGTPLVNGASQIGGSLNIDGCSASVTGWVKAGDYIQLGGGSTATLLGATGCRQQRIWRSIFGPVALGHSAPADDATATANTVGRFRLATGIQDWSINNIAHMHFAAVEAIT